MNVLDALGAARRYLRDHPEEIARAARNALGLRLGVPLAAVRWLAERAEASGKVRDVSVESVPPGFRLGASFSLMGAPLRASAVLYVERLHLSDEELAVTLRIEELDLRVTGETSSPVAALIRSGALDLSRPGNLVAYLPQRPPVVVDARDNRITLDLMRDPRLREAEWVQGLVALLTSFVTLQSVEADGDHLDLAFRPLPRGLMAPVRSFRERVVPLLAGRLLRG